MSDYYNLLGRIWMLPFCGRQYRIVPGINRNLPNGLEISHKDELKLISQTGPSLTNSILHTPPLKSVEQIRKEAIETKRNEILLSDLNDETKKESLLKIEEESNEKI